MDAAGCRIFSQRPPSRRFAGRRRGLRGRAGPFPRRDKRPPPNRRRTADKTARASGTRCGAWMPRQTLEILPRRFNSFPAAKCFDLAREKYKLRLRLVDGVIAQLVERLNGIQEVRSSSLLGSTSLRFSESEGCRAEAKRRRANLKLCQVFGPANPRRILHES